ncbi:AAEL004011-PA, partial [Aedes aegypti]
SLSLLTSHPTPIRGNSEWKRLGASSTTALLETAAPLVANIGTSSILQAFHCSTRHTGCLPNSAT